MRYLRARRRFKFILITLLTVAVILFFETRVESFAPQFKYFAESKIGEMFDKKINISIGTLDGGIVRPLTLTGCEIRDEKGDILFPYISIENIILNYRIWDAFFKGRESRFTSHFLAKEPYVDIKFRARDKEIFGFIRLKNMVDHLNVKGYINTFNKDRIDIKGDIKDGRFELEFKLKHGLLTAEGSLFSGDILTNLKINHFKFNGFDIVCDGVLKNKVKANPKNLNDYIVEGSFETQSLIINYKPFLDIKMSYVISGDKLEIISLEAGKDFRLSGWMSLAEPYTTNMVLTADNANLNKLFSSFEVSEKDIFLTGIMNGKFEWKGTMPNLKLTANLEMEKGYIKGMDFERLNATLKGDGPIVRIEDSRITRAGGYLILSGEIDFSKLGKTNMFEGVKLVTDDSAMLWDDLASSKGKGYEEVKMTKKMSDEVNIGFKKFVNDYKVDESMWNKDEVEVNYKLHSNESLKLMVGQDKDFFGLEHKDKF